MEDEVEVTRQARQTIRSFITANVGDAGVLITFGNKVAETNDDGEATHRTKFAAFGDGIAKKAIQALFSASDIEDAIGNGNLDESFAKAEDDDDERCLLTKTQFGEGDDAFVTLSTPAQVNVTFTVTGDPEDWVDEDSGVVHTTTPVRVEKVEAAPDYVFGLAKAVMARKGVRKVTKKS